MDLPIPPSFKIGDAKGLGDCFYDAVAQGLNQIKPKSKFTVKSLRMLCKDYAVKQMKMASSWLRGALENKMENQHLDYYASCIEYCADDFANPRSKVMSLKLDNPIWGRPEIEGRIICDHLNVRLHVIEKHVVQNETICIDEVVDKNGSRSINSVDYTAGDIAHIVNKGADHFEPLLRKEIQIAVPISEPRKMRNASNGHYRKPQSSDAQSNSRTKTGPGSQIERKKTVGSKPIRRASEDTPIGLADGNDKMPRTCRKEEDANEAIEAWSSQIIDRSGSKSVEIVDYFGNDTIHIVNAGNHHFKPILRKEVVPNKEKDRSSSCLSDDARAELGVDLIGAVRDKVSEEVKLADIMDILKKGGDVNFKDANMRHNTAMHYAVQLNLQKVFQYLCEHGADASLRNSDNLTPLEMASPTQSTIYTEILDSVSKNDANTRKLSQAEVDAIILKEFTGARSHLQEIRDTIESQGHSLTEIESTYVNDQYLALCLKYWLGDIRAKMLIECSQYTTSDIDAIQTLDQVPAPFQESNSYKRLSLHKGLLDEDRRKLYMDSFRSQIVELVNSQEQKTFSLDEIQEEINKLVPEMKDLEQVKSHFNQLAKNRMNECDRKQIEETYINTCLKWFLQNAEKVKDFDVKQIRNILSQLPGISKLNEIGENRLSPFHEISGYKLAMKHHQLITDRRNQTITLEFKTACVNCVLNATNSISREVKFLQSLSKYLDSVKDTDAISTKLGLSLFRDRSLSFHQLHEKIMNLDDNNDNNLSALKEAAEDIGDGKIVLEESLLELISKYLEEPKIETKMLDGLLGIEVTGYNITISKVIAKVEEQLRKHGQVEEVRIVAASTVHNDRNITDPSIWHGKNIVVNSRVLSIHGNVTWNVSGNASNHTYTSSAKDGTQVGEHGHKGADGEAGESGGQVLISVTDIEKSHNFTIISSGGSGGKGQDGGKGKDGADGYGIPWDAFWKNFPPPSKTIPSKRPPLVLQNVSSIKQNLASLKFGWYENLRQWSETYDLNGECQSFLQSIINLCGCDTIALLQGTTRQGNEITFAYHCGSMITNSQSYLLYKGAPGEEGCPGGQGGQKGDGGYGGEIKVLAPGCSVNCIANRGNAGENGKGGLYGKHGKSSWDMGYMDYQILWKYFRPLSGKGNEWPEYFGGAQNKKLQLTYYGNNDYTRLICPYRHSKGLPQKYVRITEIPEQKTSLETHEERTQNKAVGAKEVQAVAVRKKAISHDTIRSSYSHIVQNEFHVNFDLDELKQKALEQLAEITAEKTEKQTEHTLHRRATYSPPIRNPIRRGEHGPAEVIETSAADVFNLIKESSLSNENWESDWLVIEDMELSTKELQILFRYFQTQSAPSEVNSYNALVVKRILEAKFQMATLSDNANKLPRINTPIGTPGPNEAARLLHEHQGGCETSCPEMGILSKYFCLVNQENISRVQETCRIMVDNLVADLQNVGEQQTVEEVIQRSRNSVLVKTLQIYMNLERKGNVIWKPCAIFNMVECCSDKKITDRFLEEVKKGPSSPSYRELLARFYKVNIRVCQKTDGKFILISDHNPTGKMKIYFCKDDEHYSQLGMNESYWKLNNERKWHGAVHEKIIHDIEKRRQEDYEDYFQNKRFSDCSDMTLKCVPEYFPSTDFGEIASRISLYFPGKETEMEKLLGRFGTPSCDTPQIIGIMGQILKRFTYDGNHITTLEMLVLVNAILTSIVEDGYRLDIIFWIVSAHYQRSWIVELLLLDLENYYKQQLGNKAEWRENLSRVKDRHTLLLFKKKIDEQMQTDKIPIDLMKNITLHLHHANDITYMSNLHLADWVIPLKELDYRNLLKKFTNLNNSEQLQTICYYVLGIENLFGRPLTTKLLKILNDKDPDILPGYFTSCLRNFYNETWQLNEQNLELVSKQGIEALRDRHPEISSDRTIDELKTLMKGNCNSSQEILDKLDQYAEEVKAVKKECDKYQSTFQKYYNKLVDTLEANLTTDTDSKQRKVIKQIAHIILTIKQKRKFELRDTQILAILLLLRNEGNILLQVSTGEGKSLIVVAAAIFKALQGEKVHIITSNSVLAERDAVQNRDIYKSCGIKVSHNGDKVDKRNDVYSKHQVVYGDISTFQGDYLLDKFYGKNIMGDHKLENVIVDEVDSMLLDNGNNVLYMSHDIPGLDKLENIYIYIWQRINTPAISQSDIIDALDSAKIKEDILSNMKCTVRKEDLALLAGTLSGDEINGIWEGLMKYMVIDSRGKILVAQSEVEDKVKHVACSLLKPNIIQVRICYLIKERLERRNDLKVPRYLESFVDLHLSTWIQNAIEALFMKEGHDYVVDVDRTGTRSDANPNITIIDRDTGTDQGNSQWEEALHQFLQLKHGCKLSMQSLKAVFISNVSYFKLYSNVSGITGTLGSQVERDLLKAIHQVHFVVIPTARPQNFEELEAVACKDQQEWSQRIVQECREMVYSNRSCLVICDTIHNVDVLRMQLKASGIDKAHAYKRDYEVLTVANEQGGLRTGQIIIATNLAGRGTDIKLSEDLKKSGGLHVCLTYLPNNNRVEQQAYGRSARCGDKGSARLIIVGPRIEFEGSSHVFLLKADRNNAEAHRISQIKLNYEQQVRLEEKLFQKFTSVYECLRNKVGHMLFAWGQGEVALQGCLDRWAFWLDANSHRVRAAVDDKGRDALDISLDAFLDKLRKLERSKLESWIVMDDDNSSKNILLPRAIQMGKLLAIDRCNEAIDLFDRLIRQEPFFCEAAHYYKAFVMIKNENYTQVKAEFRKAARIFENRRCDVMNAAGLIDTYKERCNRTSILQINAYKEQKENEWRIYDILLRSIDDILGHTVTPDSLIGPGINKDNADAIYKALIETGLLEKPKIAFSHKDGDFEMLCKSNGICVDSFANFLKARNDKEFHEQHFQNELEKNIPLPMREVLWATMGEQKALKDVVKFVVVKKDEFSNLEANEADYKGGKGEHYVFLNLESAYIENTCVYTEKAFEGAVGSGVYANLKNSNRVSVIERAVISPGNLETMKFPNFDSLEPADFLRTGIMESEAQLILEILEKRNILRKNGSEETYRLEGLFQWIELPSCPLYENAVNELIATRFAYRTALQKIQQLIKSGCCQIELPLQSKPHQALMWELVSQNIITPVKVNSNAKEFVTTLGKMTNPMLPDEIRYHLFRKLENLQGRYNNSRSMNVCLEPILDRISGKLTLPIEDIKVFSLNGLGDVVVFSDRLPQGVLWNFAAMAIGVVQMCAGIVLFFKTGSLNSQPAEALFQEGLADIAFAMSTLWSGNFSWKDYAKQKLRILITYGITSIAKMTVSSLKPAKLSSNAAQGTASLLASKHLSQLALKRLTPAIRKCQDQARLETQLNAGLQGVCQLIITNTSSKLQRQTDSTSFSSTIWKAYSAFRDGAVAKVAAMIQKIQRDITSQGKWKEAWREIANLVTDEISEGCQGLRATDANLEAIIANIMGPVKQKLTNAKNSLKADGRSVEHIVSELRKMINEESNYKRISEPQKNDVKFQNVKREVICLLKSHVDKELQQYVLGPMMAESSKLLNEFLQRKLRKTFNFGQIECDLSPFVEYKEEYYTNLQNSQEAIQPSVTETLEMHFREVHNEKLLKLRSTSRDPKLFATMIRDNGPMDLECLDTFLKTISSMKVMSEGFAVIVQSDCADRQKFSTATNGAETKFLNLHKQKFDFLDKNNNRRNYDSIITFLSEHVHPFNRSKKRKIRSDIVEFLKNRQSGLSSPREGYVKESSINGLEEEKDPYQHDLWKFNPKTDVDIRDIDERYPPHSLWHYSKALNVAVDKLKEKLGELQCSSDKPILLDYSDFTATESCAIQYPGIGKQSEVNCPVEFRAEKNIHIPEDSKQATYHMTIDYHNSSFAGFAVPCGPYVRYRIGRVGKLGPHGVTGFVLLNKSCAFEMIYSNPEKRRFTFTTSNVFLNPLSGVLSKSLTDLTTEDKLLTSCHEHVNMRRSNSFSTVRDLKGKPSELDRLLFVSFMPYHAKNHSK